MITVRPYTAPMRDAWNAFLDTAKNATFLFHRDFMEYHADRFQDYSLTLWEDETLVGLLPANLTQGTVHSHQGLSYGGLVVHRAAKLPLIMDCFSAALRYMSTDGIGEFRYKKSPRFYHAQGDDEVDYALFLLQAELYRRDISLAIPQGDPLPMQTRRLRAVKQGQAAGITLREETDLAPFWDSVLSPNLQQRFGVSPVHTLAEITSLQGYFPQHIRQFCAYQGDTLLAGTTIFETPTVAHAQYIAATEEGRKSGALDFLFHQLITEQYADKAYFDFGIVNEEEGQQVNRGLLDWKEGFGGRSFAHDFYRVDPKQYTLLEERFR